MGEVIVFPDVTAIAIGALRTYLTAHALTGDVAATVPTERSIGAGPLVLVRRIGGDTRSIVLQDAVMAIEAWDDEAEDAHDLCQLALGVVSSLAGTVTAGTPVYRVAEITGPLFEPDPESDQPRYTATATVTVRGHRP